MYTSTDPKQIQQEVETAQRIIAKYEGREALCMAHRDALSSAHATIRMYADLVDEHGHVAEYRGKGEVTTPQGNWEREYDLTAADKTTAVAGPFTSFGEAMAAAEQTPAAYLRWTSPEGYRFAKVPKQ